MHTLHLDESGYTGDDLFDAAQPIFVIATSLIANIDGVALKREFFASAGSTELKHTTLQRRRGHQIAIANFLRAIVERNCQVRAAIAHKRFALTLKMIDYIIEPVAHRHGMNIYRDGFFRSFGNLAYFTLSVEGAPILDRLLTRFQTLIRTRTQQSWKEFVDYLNESAPIQIIDEVLDIFRAHVRQMAWSDITTLPPHALDISMTVALQCLYAWTTSGSTPLRVLHDRSSNMSRQRSIWDAIVSPAAPPALVGYGSQGVQFPLGVTETEFVESKDSVGVQLTDIIAGALARWTRWLSRGRPDGDQYALDLDNVFSSFPQPLFSWMMWPVPDVGRSETPAAYSDPLDYLTKRVASIPD